MEGTIEEYKKEIVQGVDKNGKTVNVPVAMVTMMCSLDDKTVLPIGQTVTLAVKPKPLADKPN